MKKSLSQVIMLALIINMYSCQQANDTGNKHPNILFIAVDDLRTELGCYGNEEIKSPNIDRLANEGILFRRAYCQEPICMSSRASLMSGLRPDTLRIFMNGSLNEYAPGVVTLNQHFQNNGYQIWASGKIYHHGIDRELQWGEKRICARN